MPSPELTNGSGMKPALVVTFTLLIVIAATVGFLAVRDTNTTAGYVIVVAAVFVLSIGAGIALKASRKS